MRYELRAGIKALSILFQSSYPLISAVYLFGSFAKERETSTSDIDFALLLEENEEIEKKAFLAYEIEKRLGFIAPVEVIILNDQNLLFKFQVIKEGRIIYEAKRDLRVRFETCVLREYHRLEFHIKFFEQYRLHGVLKRLGVDGNRDTH